MEERAALLRCLQIAAKSGGLSVSTTGRRLNAADVNRWKRSPQRTRREPVGCGACICGLSASAKAAPLNPLPQILFFFPRSELNKHSGPRCRPLVAPAVFQGLINSGALRLVVVAGSTEVGRLAERAPRPPPRAQRIYRAIV